MCSWCLRFRYVGPGRAVLSEDTIVMRGSSLSNCPVCYPGSDLLHKSCVLARVSHSRPILYVEICKDFYFKNIFKCYNHVSDASVRRGEILQEAAPPPTTELICVHAGDS